MLFHHNSLIGVARIFLLTTMSRSGRKRLSASSFSDGSDLISNNMSYDVVSSKLRKSATGSSSASKRFFKTGIGDYAEHDQFIGISVPTLRNIAKDYEKMSDNEIVSFLNSSINEERLFALIIMTNQYKKSDTVRKDELYALYIDNINCINNWNLVDSSAHLIIGPHLENGNRSFLLELASSDNMWKRRIAILSTLHYIRKNDFEDTLHISTLLLEDSHDLIHKAVGWMLREVGKRNKCKLLDFLKEHHRKMNKTTLRYAIEKFNATEQRKWLNSHGNR